MKAGRTRNVHAIRDASGISRDYKRRQEEDYALTLRRRESELAREGISLTTFDGKQTAVDRLSGFTLGKLLLRQSADKGDPSGISQAQYDAGDTWAKLVHKHAAMMGYDLKLNTKSPSFMMVGNGLSCATDPDEEDVVKIRRKYSDCYNCLMAASRDHSLRVRDVTYGVCVENWPTESLSTGDYGFLRVGLNSLGRVLT